MVWILLQLKELLKSNKGVLHLKILRMLDVLNKALVNVMKIGREFFGGGGSVR